MIGFLSQTEPHLQVQIHMGYNKSHSDVPLMSTAFPRDDMRRMRELQNQVELTRIQDIFPNSF